jgi:hypothetical protein
MFELIEFAIASGRLALRGELLRDQPAAAKEVAKASAAGLAVGVLLVAAGRPVWLATLVGGGVAGYITPRLLKGIQAA